MQLFFDFEFFDGKCSDIYWRFVEREMFLSRHPNVVLDF